MVIFPDILDDTVMSSYKYFVAPVIIYLERFPFHFALEKPCNIFCILHGVKCILCGVKGSHSLELLLF